MRNIALMALLAVQRETFHRSLIALENAGALDLAKLRSNYYGDASSYRVAVEIAFEYTAKYALKGLKSNIDEIEYCMNYSMELRLHNYH